MIHESRYQAHLNNPPTPSPPTPSGERASPLAGDGLGVDQVMMNGEKNHFNLI